MIIVTNNAAEHRSAIAALKVINSMRTLATRPAVESTQWIRTVWPNENYL